MPDSLTFQVLSELITAVICGWQWSLRYADSFGVTVRERWVDGSGAQCRCWLECFLWLLLCLVQLVHCQFVGAGGQGSMPFISFRCAACICDKVQLVAWKAIISPPKNLFWLTNPNLFRQSSGNANCFWSGLTKRSLSCFYVHAVSSKVVWLSAAFCDTDIFCVVEDKLSLGSSW